MEDELGSIQARDAGEDSPLRLIYFYYLTPDHEALALQKPEEAFHEHKRLRAFFVDQGQPKPLTDTTIEGLIADADNGRIAPLGFSVADLVWRQKGHLLFVLREGTATLRGRNAVAFEYQPPNTPPGHKGGNHSFGPLKDFAGVDKTVTGVHCVNRRLSVKGKALEEGDSEKFELTFNFSGVPLFTHLETGTNTGP